MTLGAGLRQTPLPIGFTASGVNCGVRRYRPDIGLLISDRDAVTVGVFTQNTCKAAPILYCQDLLPSSSIRSIVTNSGQANAATGSEGILNNQRLAEATARSVGCDMQQVLTASTGVIGVQMDMDKILPSLPLLVERATDRAESFALAILTTDLVPKSVSTTVRLSGGDVRITGICKGSGMIHPNMGTMLGYLLTDAKINIEQAEGLLKHAVDNSFNMISVDGDTSTNDCAFLMANGATEVPLQTQKDLETFQAALVEIAQILAQAIAIDGEGATKLIEVNIQGLSDLTTARRAARGITLSPLVKTAMHGEDPNWGRILARLGAEQVSAEDLNSMTLKMQGHTLFTNGAPVSYSRPDVVQSLKASTIVVDIIFQSGNFSATAWGCDLSKKYIDINTEYPT